MAIRCDRVSYGVEFGCARPASRPGSRYDAEDASGLQSRLPRLYIRGAMLMCDEYYDGYARMCALDAPLLNNVLVRYADFVTVKLEPPSAWLRCGHAQPAQADASYERCALGDRLALSGAENATGCADACAATAARIVQLDTDSAQVAWDIPVGDSSQRLFVALVTQAVQVSCAAVLLVVILSSWS